MDTIAAPQVKPGGGGLMIPAGTLNDDVPVQPDSRIFRDSHVNWLCSGDDLPVYERYPPAEQADFDLNLEQQTHPHLPDPECDRRAPGAGYQLFMRSYCSRFTHGRQRG